MRRIDNLFQLISSGTYKNSFAQAKAANICLRCGRPAKGFTDCSSELEYRISALCQSCQEECFSRPAVDRFTPRIS
jgi:hypothetical protein